MFLGKFIVYNYKHVVKMQRLDAQKLSQHIRLFATMHRLWLWLVT